MFENAAKIIALQTADVLAVFALWTLMIYLTDVWKLSFTHAAAILNLYLGLTNILALIMPFIVDTLTGNYWMLLSSSIAYCTGLGFLSMSTPPVLSKVSGNCGSYEPECIGDTQRILFYFALPLLAAGVAGHMVSLGSFFVEQFPSMMASVMEDGIKTSTVCSVSSGNFAAFAVTVFAILGHPYIKPWSLHFGIPAIFTLVATLVFLSGSSTYTYVRPQGSHLTLVIRVLVASASKLFHQTPADPNALHEAQAHSLTAHGFRCLNKAAIVLPDQSVEEQKKNKWKLCTVREVEATKLIISSLPMITMPFIIIGLLSTLGMTFFVEQAKNMNRKVGSLTIPLPIFLCFYFLGKKFPNVVSFVREKVLPRTGLMNAPTKAVTIDFSVMMILGVLCTVTAAKVESHRLDVVKSHGLFDKPDETVPMSVFWLLPQFVLLGATDWMLDMRAYTHCIGNVLGCIGSILAVYVLGKISERGGKPSWFQDTINQSRLDNYYWFLACLCAIHLAVYVVLRTFCYCRKGKTDEDEQTSPQQESDSCCCFC